MKGREYQELAMRTMADQEAIRQRIFLTGPKATQLDGGLRGLTDEVGEIASAVKKYLEYNQPLNERNVLEECGDAIWRIAQILDAIGMTVEDAMVANIAKLQIRYPTKYEDELAAEANRRRDEESKVMEFVRSETGEYNPHANWAAHGAP